MDEDGGNAVAAHTPGYSSPARLSGERSPPTDDVLVLGVLFDKSPLALAVRTTICAPLRPGCAGGRGVTRTARSANR
ncbi:MAG: hypothetical protein IPL18_15060 [Sphingomonadales bacterium]|nr:hypothetical protein [Sphingomonadales bacterium]